jgi:deoxyribonuclease-1
VKHLAFLLFLSISGFAIADEALREELHKATNEGYVSLSYKEARIKLFNDIYLEKDEKGYFNTDVYCLTKFYRTFKKGVPDTELPDANVFNTEHTYPQSKFNESLSEEVQKTDLHHLFPTGNKINGQRGNFPFGNVGVATNKKPLACDISKLGNPLGYGQGTYFEPPTEHKGNVARAMFYFAVKNQVGIPENEEIFLKFWHMLDPIDENEKARHEKIAEIQKNRNPFIDHPELVLEIENF